MATDILSSPLKASKHLPCPLEPGGHSEQPTMIHRHSPIVRCPDGKGRSLDPLWLRVAFEPRVLSVQLLRLLLNFMDHKPHRNKERERPCY